MKINVYTILVFFFAMFFLGCATSNINNEYKNKQKVLQKKQNENNFVNKNYLSNLNIVEKMTAKECAALYGKTLYNANSSELYCKNFMLYMKKLNENSLKFCNLYKIKGLLPYQCYEIATIGFELEKKYKIKPNYQKIVQIYKQIVKKYQKYSVYSTTNLILKEKILKTTIQEYLKGEKHD